MAGAAPERDSASQGLCSPLVPTILASRVQLAEGRCHAVSACHRRAKLAVLMSSSHRSWLGLKEDTGW